MSNITELAIAGALKTQAPFWDRHGGSFRLIWEKYIYTPLGIGFSALIIILTLVEWVWPNAKVDAANYFQGVIAAQTEDPAR